MADNKGPNKQDINEIKNALKEIQKLYDTLGGKNPFAGVDSKKLASSADEVKKLKDNLQDAREAVSDMDGEAGDLFKSWKAIADEVKGNRRVLTDSKNTVSKINDLSQKIKDHQSKVNALSAKDLNSIKSKLEQQKSSLKVNRDSLQSSIDELTAKKKAGTATTTELSQLKESELVQKNITGGLEKDSGILDQIISKTEKEAKLRKEIETSLGVTGGILKGMSKIPLIKDIVDTDKILKAANDEIEHSKSGIKGLGAGFKAMGSQIKSGITNPANLALGFITQMTAALQATDSGAGDLAKSMNITYSEALKTRKELGTMAALSMDSAVNTRGLQETLITIGKSLGSNASLNEKDLVIATKLREQAGYTNEELVELNKLSAINGKSIEDNTKEILGGAKAYASRKGLVLNEKQILNDVVNASATLKVSLGGSADALAKSAVQARSVGLNLEQAADMADQLLNFESSIENELSAELLTGKDLNFERARGLALNNDIAGAAEEIAKQVGTSADFANMNAIQQEAIAKAAGLTKDQLAQSLMDREALAKLSGVEGKDAKEKFDNLVKQVGMEEAKKQLGDEQLANQFAQQSVQERFAQATEKLQEMFVSLAEPVLAILSPLMDIVTSVLPAINLLLSPLLEGFSLIGSLVSGFINGLKEGQPIIVGLTAALVAMKAQAIMTAIFSIFGSLARLGIPGLVLAGVATAGMISLATSSSKKGDDVMSPGQGGGGYGSRTLLGPEGAIQLNNKDTVIAGTNLFDKGDDVMSGPKGALSVSNRTAPKKEITQDPNSGINARLDRLISTTGKVNAIPTLRIQ